MIQILTSNRLEVLAAELCARVAGDPLDPFERETIIVQSQGISRWLTLEFARRQGIAASLDFPLPRRFCHELADRVLGESERAAAGRGFDREAMTWAIYADVERWPSVPPLAEPTAYLSNDSDRRKRYRLARRIATLFEAYQVYRHELLLDWERASEGELAALPWQAILWRRLVAGSPKEQSLARRLASLIERLEGPSPGDAELPRRVNAFGIVRVAPAIVRLLTALGRWIPVQLYLVSPTPEYWGDVLGEKEALRMGARGQGGASTASGPVVEPIGNELLASWGRQGREFFTLLQQSDESGEAWTPLEFCEPDRDSALGVLQSDIFAMASRRSDDQAERCGVSQDDGSIEVHVCHSRLREVEVLSDRLLAAFAEDPELRPYDVMVLVPNLRRYAPYIEAVFGSAGEDVPQIPFRIADRAFEERSCAAAALLSLLELVGGRVAITQVVELLNFPGVCRRFDVRPAEVDAIGDLLRSAGVRWGIDGEYRRTALALPEVDANSWRAGLDRLVMGYATGTLDTIVAGVAPQDAGDEDLLCRTLVFVDAVFELLGMLQQPRSTRAWARDLAAALDRLYLSATEEEEQELGHLRAAIASLGDFHTILGELALSRAVARLALEERLSATASSAGYLSGKVTFCELEPMRVVPARMICVLGLDADSFPRSDSISRLDLMMRSPRPCDRNRARDDRQLFLELFLAARSRLLLSYCGWSPTDAKSIAPSAVVDELLEQIDRSFIVEGHERARDRFVIHQPLHAFDRRCFERSDPHRWSFRAHSCIADARSAAQRSGGLPFVVQALDSPAPDEIELSDLIRFWTHPARYFCEQVLGMQLLRGETSVDDNEPFALGALEEFELASWMAARRLGQEETETEVGEEALLRAKGRLPVGVLGSAPYAELRRDVSSQLARLGRPSPIDPQSVSIRGEGWVLSGVVEQRSDQGLVAWHYAKVKLRQLAPAWIKLLALSAAGDGSGPMPMRARVLGRSPAEDWELSLPDGAGEDRPALETLGRLVEGYRAGRLQPLPFFSAASRAFVEALRGGKDEAQAREAANQAYQVSAYGGWQDANDVYVSQCFRASEPLETCYEEFRRWASVFWDPLFEARVGK